MITLKPSYSGRQVVILSVFAVIGFITAGCSQNLDDLRTQGVDEFRNRQYIESTATFRQALAMQADDAQSNYYMGLNYRVMAAEKFRQGNIAAACRELDTAIIYFTNAIKTWPNYMEAVASKNEAFESRGKYDAALNLAQHVASNNRGVSDHYIYLGNEYRERGDYDNALKAYKTALAGNPDSSKAYAAIGKLYLAVNDRTMAQDAFRRAYELNPDEPGAADNLNAAETRQFAQGNPFE